MHTEFAWLKLFSLNWKFCKIFYCVWNGATDRAEKDCYDLIYGIISCMHSHFFSCVAFQYILFVIVNKFHVAWLQTKITFLIKNPRDYFITHISHKQADRNQLLFFLTCIAITFVHLNSCLPFLITTPFSYSLLRSLGPPGASVDPPQQKTFQSSKWAASKRRIPALSQPVELPWCLWTLAYQSLSVQKTRVPRQFW